MDDLKKYFKFSDFNAVNNIFNPLQLLGIKGFFYVKLYQDGTFVDLTTDPYWAEYYLKNFYAEKYAAADIKENYLPRGINLWELNKSNLLWSEARELYGVGNGFSLSLPNQSGFTEIFFYYADADNYKINDLYLNRLDIFKSFAAYFKDKAHKLIKDAEHFKITIPKAYKDIVLSNTAFDTETTSIKNYYSGLNLKKFYFSDKDYLTYKEAECLNWYARGMTIKETAKLLNLSHKTIESYLDKIKIKLACSNKTSLTNMAIQLGIFDFFYNQ